MKAEDTQVLDEEPAETATRVMPVADSDRFALLEQIGRLRESGVLTDEEFAAEKKRILGGD